MRITDPKFQTLLKDPIVTTSGQGVEDSEISNKIKTFAKRWPGLYNFLKKTVGPSYSPGNKYNFKDHINRLFGGSVGDGVVLNLGSGTYRIHPEIINVDLFAFREVDIVADICNTPFKDNSIDGVICEDVLEHIAQAPKLFKEMSRILKPGGVLLIKIPFLYPYHSSPDDFFRWTEEGIKYALKENNFNVTKVGVHGGPMGALQGILMHIFAIIFSFGSKTLYFILVQFFMVVFSPLKLLDPLLMLSPFAIDAASHLFVISEKNK